MIATREDEVEGRAPELDRALAVDDLIVNDDVGGLELREPLLGTAVRNHGGAGILEHLAAGDVIVVVVTIDQVLDRGLGNLADLIQVGFCRLRPSVTDWIGDDDAGGR